MIPDDITTAAWRLSAEHLLRGQKDPTTMIAEAIRDERKRCLEIAASCCGSDSEVVRQIRDGREEADA